MARSYTGLDKRFVQIVEEGDKLFSDRRNVDILFQELAENFYPERADFTVTSSNLDRFASNLDTSYPITARRDLGNAFGAMLRPPGKEWFTVGIKKNNIDEDGRKWLERATRIQRRAIYDRESNFVRATKEGDHDFATFGQCVISAEKAVTEYSGAFILHRCWHLRDVVWAENSYGKICAVHRKWKPGARELSNHFKGKVHPEVSKAAEKEPFRTFEVRHVVIESSDYEKKFKQPYVSIYIDVDNGHVLEEVGSWNCIYVIPRWETVSGSQYAYSPASIAALPDGRLIQAMTYTLLTAGEFSANPALIGVTEAIKGAVEAFPGGFTAVDAAYDERLGEVIRPLDKGGERAIPLNLKMIQDTRMMIADAFYLSKLAMPPAGQGGMSPYEVSQRVEEFIRQALPLFEPMETDYNGALMELDFDILLRNGAFGPTQEIPPSLQGQETEFRFESPLRDSVERIKGQKFQEALGITSQAAQVDPMAIHMVDWRTAQREALQGLGTPASWMVDDAVLDQTKQQMQIQQAKMQQMQAMGAMGQVAEQAGKAGSAIKEALAPVESEEPAEVE